MSWQAALYFQKGQLFTGSGFGAEKANGGEAVFNTGMSGYQEILTDPSYAHQVVVMTYPHIGNYGTNSDDVESRGLFAHGLIVREYCDKPSSWRAMESLSSYLEKSGVPAISGVDTRAITQLLRDEGSQNCIIFPTKLAGNRPLAEFGKELLANVPAMEGLELVSRVSTKTPYEFEPGKPSSSGDVVVYDYGVKTHILRSFRDRGFRVRVVPYNYPHQEILRSRPLAVVLTNGPGDPATVKGAPEEVQKLVGQIPIFAVCMGHQLLARALGGSTFKLKFGHHGVNHPVKDLELGKILITSQNHGFAVKAQDLKSKDVQLSHVSLNDQTVEGFASKKLKLSSFQFHPEAKPGPSDANYLFDQFIRGYLQ